MEIFTDEKKEVIYKTPNSATHFDELTKLTTRNNLNVFSFKEKEEVCGILFKTTEKEHLLLEKNVKCSFRNVFLKT